MKIKFLIIGLMAISSFNAMSASSFILGPGINFLAGYKAVIVFTNGGNETVMDGSFNGCKAKLLSRLSFYSQSGVGIFNNPQCEPTYASIPELIQVWDFILDGPNPCLSCVLLNEITFKKLYKRKDEYIREVFYQYKIDRYQRELKYLQARYDLKGFENRVFELNKAIREEGVRSK